VDEGGASGRKVRLQTGGRLFDRIWVPVSGDEVPAARLECLEDSCRVPSAAKRAVEVHPRAVGEEAADSLLEEDGNVVRTAVSATGHTCVKVHS